MPDARRIDWRALVDRRAAEQGRPLSADVVEELACYFADVYADAREAGEADDAAYHVALTMLERGEWAELAGRRRVRTEVASRLSERTGGFLGRVWSDAVFDIRYALRTMRRNVRFSAVVIAILAVGIGATTAAFTVIDAVLLNPLPYPQPNQLVVLKRVIPAGDSGPLSAADWIDYASRHADMLTLAAYASWPMNLTGGGDPIRLRSVIVSGHFFDVAGRTPALGRALVEADDRPSAPAVVVLSHGFWTRRFGRNPRAVGTSVLVNGHPAAVVGVMPPDFALPTGDIDLWMPMALSPQLLADRASGWLSVMGRLRSSTRASAAQAALSLTAASLAERFPRTNRDARISVTPLLEVMVGSVRRLLWLGGAAVVFVLVVACANAANLLLARASVRRDEMALRAALGAEPSRLARQLLAEGAVLTAGGCVLGIGAAAMFLRAFVMFAEGRVPRVEHAHLDVTAIFVSVLASLATVGLFGGGAAWSLGRASPRAAHHHDAQRTTGAGRIGGILLASQIAFALILLTGAFLVARTYAATTRIDPGFDVSDTVTMQLTLPRGRYADSVAHVRFADRALEQLIAVAGVTSAGVVSDLPFVGNQLHFQTDVEPADNGPAKTIQLGVRLADPGYFPTLRIPLESGRYFDAGDRPGGMQVAIVNHTAAERLWGTRALGRSVHVAGDSSRRIVGVVGDIRHAGLHKTEDAVIYVPYAQKTFDFVNWLGIVVRGPGLAASSAQLKGAIRRIDPNQPVYNMMAMDDYVMQEQAPYRLSALVIGCLAGAAFVLAMAGIYGLTAFIVGTRSREIGVRLALGASRPAVVMLVMRQIATVLAIGSAIGLAGAVLTAGVLRAAISESAGGDPGALVGAMALLVATSGFAALWPALRAARIDPKVALQAE